MTSTTLAAPARLPKLPPSPLRLALLALLPLLLLGSPGCSDDSPAPPDAPLVDGGHAGDAAPDLARPRRIITADRTVSVTLDGKPIAGAVVSQGGNPTRWRTGVDGTVAVHLDVTIPGDMWVMASLPQARIGSTPITPNGPLAIALASFTTQDGDSYEFQHPGTPDKYNYDTSFCAHCHVTMTADWYASPHRRSAANPTVQDLYAGAAAALSTEGACVAAGGRWRMGIGPGTGKPAPRCYLGAGALPDLNPGCDQGAPCDGKAPLHGGCADCHAPGIDGVLGGRDLLEATGIAYDYGVHCDVCHKVESIDPAGSAAPAGVAGRLRLLRPFEPAPSPTLGKFLPLTFGPFDDVPNPRMGSVARDHFHEAGICGGCHQLDLGAQIPGATIDRKRWPDGKVPIQSTFEEWKAGPFAPTTPCQSCHMPADARVLNSSDLQLFLVAQGAAGGWPRPFGTTRRHIWAGPRQPTFGMLQLAAALTVQKSVANNELTVHVKVHNVGCGHALPTGEAMRSLVLRVEARCGGQPLTPTGGDSIPDFGGHFGRKAAGDDWSVWPGARVGQVVRVVRRTGDFFDYAGFGPFGDGRFSPADKGLPVEQVVGESTITAVNGNQVAFDRALPAGSVAFLGERDVVGMDGAPSTALAGAPGFAFARVLVSKDGERLTPSHRAVDVASDNRLLPGKSWSSTHRFVAACPDPQVHAALVHRAYPLGLARERQWTLKDSLMAEVTR